MTSLPLLPLAFFGLGSQELFIVLIIVLVVFGAAKLPQLGAGVGKSIRNFKKEMRKGKEEDADADADDDGQDVPRAVVQVEVRQPEAIGTEEAAVAAQTETASKAEQTN